MTARKLTGIEAYARERMVGEPGHDFEHVNRVRHWAVKIARAEGYTPLEAAEAAALLHDIGLPDARPRRKHGERGAELARDFLEGQHLFEAPVLEEIEHAIRFHCTNRGGEGQLLDILRDADMMDMFGAVGLLRGIVFVADKPLYDPDRPKGVLWGASAGDFDKRIDEGLGIGDTITDVLNFHISCYENLATASARSMAAPMAAFLQDVLMRVESEVRTARDGPEKG